MWDNRRLTIESDIINQTSDFSHEIPQGHQTYHNIWHQTYIRSLTSDIHQTSDAWHRTSANKHQMAHLKSNIIQILRRDHRSNIYQTSDIRHHTHVTHQTSHPMCFGAIRCLTSDRHQMSAIWQQTSDTRQSDNRRLMTSFVTDVWCQTSDVWWQMSNNRGLMTEVWYQTSDVRCLMTDVWKKTSDIRGLMTDVRRLMWDVWSWQA